MHAAQVLLTSYDLSVRMHYLNARQALRRLLELAHGAGRERERHHGDRRDHLRRQRLPLRPAGAAARGAAAGPAHRHRRACTRADPDRDPGGRAGRPGRRLRRARRLRDRRPHLALRLRGHAQQGLGGRDGERRRDPGGDLRRDRGRARCSRPPAATTSEPGSSPIRSAPRRSSSGSATRSRRAAGCWSTRAPRGSCARAARACCRSGSSGSRASSTPATRSTSSATGPWSARGSSTTLPPSWCGSRE